MLPARGLTKGEDPHEVQQAPSAPPQSLNKYKVLPPIKRRESKESLPRSLNKQMPDDAFLQPRSSDQDGPAGRLGIRPESCDAAPAKTKAAGSSGTLLLVIRAPCGRRFEQHFDPSDTLQAVRASAEARYGVRYEDAFIETTALPRKTLTDLDMTLAQCGILNRSVLHLTEQ